MKEFLVLSILSIKGFGPKYLFRSAEIIKGECNSSETVLEAITNIFEKTKRMNKVTLEEIEKGIASAELILDNCKKYNIKPLSFLDEKYPSKVKESSDLWPIIYAIGNTALLSEYNVGVIGSNHPDQHGQIISKKITEFTDEEEITVGIMHQKGVSSIVSTVKDSNVIEVVSSGIDQIYLPSDEVYHSQLRCVISPFAPEILYDDYKFIESCKLLSSISNRIILIQDNASDDTRFVISYFARMPKTLGIVKPIESAQKFPSNAGNMLLIKEGKEGIIQYCKAKDVTDKTIQCSIQIITSKNDYAQFFMEDELPF